MTGPDPTAGPTSGPSAVATAGASAGPTADRLDLAGLIGAFGQLLHAAGVPVTPERSGRFVRAVVLARPATTDELYWAGRVTLLSGHDQIEVYDRVFTQVFRGVVDVTDARGDPNAPELPPPASRPAPERRPSAGGRPGGTSERPGTASAPGAADEGEPEAVLAAASTEERLRQTSFASLTALELAGIRALLAALPLAPPPRLSRRAERHRAGRDLDLRATLRRAHRQGGDPVERVHRRPKQRPRRLVLLADISGSMEPYARAYLHLLHGAVRATRAEAFVFATRLTRLTRALAVTDPDRALARAAAAMPDWSGGTRIGAALKSFNDGYGRRGMARGAVVVIVSDGWERDDPRLLGEQLARLARLAHRIVWVNPRAAAPSFEPLVAGLRAALPHVDTLVSGHSLAAMDDVLDAIGQ